MATVDQYAEYSLPAPFSLTVRAAVATALGVVLLVTAVFGALAHSVRRTAAQNEQRNLAQSAELVYAQFLVGRERTLRGGARVFVQNPQFRSLLATGRREDVLDRAAEAAEQIEASWVFITDANGGLIAKSDEPGVSGSSMAKYPLVAGALGGQEQGGFGASGDAMLFQAVALPISAKLGAPAGVLVATRVIDSAFIQMAKSATNSDLLFYTHDEHNRDHPAASTIAGSARELATLLAERAPPSGDADNTVVLGGVRYAWLGTSLSTAGGDIVGGFLVLRARDSAFATLAPLRTPLFIALAMGAILTLVVTLLVSRTVTRPAQALAQAVTRAAGGDLSAQLHKANSDTGAFEVRELSTAFEALVHDLRDKEALIAAARIGSPSTIEAAPAEGPWRTPRSSRVIGSKSIASVEPISRSINHPGLVLEPGSVLASRYHIQAEVGRGGLGIVYRALDRVLGETIAIKVLRPELVLAHAAAFEQLKLEVRITRRLSHRNVVRTYDIGETTEVPFLTMEYVDGASLASVIQRRGALSRGAVLAIAKQLLGALAVAHDHGIVHGDLKPQNLLIDANGLLKVTDFGVARLVRGARLLRPDSASVLPDARDLSVTRLAGAVIGTPEYMAPEQLIGERSSIQSDLYAAGVVLNECITGVTPYQADTPVAFVARKLGADAKARGDDELVVEPRSRNGANGDMCLIVDTLMHPRAELRPLSARDALARFTALG